MDNSAKFEVMFELHKQDFSKSIEKHYTSIDRLTNGLDDFDYSAVDVIAKRQYTGLKDRKGNEIYEGDILYCHSRHYELVKDVGKAYELHEYNDGSKTGKNYFLFQHNDYVQVVGNIYETPNLLANSK